MLDNYHLVKEADAVLLNCFDNYQGIISFKNIRFYDLRLATRIEIKPQFKRPDWLNPLMVIVPDQSQAPYQERFLTANIRELKFVRLDDYYEPLQKIILSIPEVEEGFRVFKNNCLFCHSLAGIGGGKGIDLLKSYSFSGKTNREQFRIDFFAFHRKGVEQFVSEAQTEEIAKFLQVVDSFN